MPEEYERRFAPAPVRELPRESEGPVTFFLDAGLFFSEDGDPRVELYVDVSYDELPFVARGGGYVAPIEVVVVFNDRSGRQVGGDSWTREVWAKGYEETIDPQRHYRARAGFSVPPGAYEVKVSCGGVNSDVVGEAVARITVPERGSEKFALSDLRLGRCVQSGVGVDTAGRASPDTAAADSLYVDSASRRRSVSFVPVASRSFGEETDSICVRAELYFWDYAEPDTAPVDVSVLDESGRPVWTDDFAVVLRGRVTELSFRVPADSLAWGEYTLAVSAAAEGVEAKRKRWFEIDESRIGLALDEELLMELISIVANREEMETLASLKGRQRKAFIDEIWRKRDPDRSTPRNEFKIQFFKRVRYAKRHFSEQGREGWRTDRGRVYIQNGPPDRIERIEGVRGSISPTATTEVWYYYGTNTRYVFEDFGGTGQFVLVDVLQG